MTPTKRRVLSFSFAWLAAVMLVATVGCDSRSSAEENGETEEPLAALTPAEQGAKMDRLVALFRAKGTVLPPLGRRSEVNDTTLDVRWETYPRDRFRALVDGEMKKILRDYAPSGDPSSLLDKPEIAWTLQAGFDDTEIRRFITDALVSAEHRTEVRALLRAAHAMIARFQVEDWSSGLLADELIVIEPGYPARGGKAIVIRLRYMQG